MNSNWTRDRVTDVCRSMTDLVAHRGPDGDGVYSDDRLPISLGHRRLSIVDLSAAGAQPMISRNERYVLVYNGEIYNSAEIRAQPALTGFEWRGHSDTESILESIVHVGLHRTLDQINGMFAFAVWDRAQQQLTLVRDPFGIKPLYFTNTGGSWAFASELRSIVCAFPEKSVSPDVIGTFLRLGYIPSPDTIYENVQKLAPGQIVTIERDGRETKSHFASVSDSFLASDRQASARNIEEEVEVLDQLLFDVVSSQMIADVPIGAFLSGGIDSSTIVALMTRFSAQQVRTYSIGFPEYSFDESGAASAVAAHLGTKHNAMTVTDNDALNLVPNIPEIYDEPFADSSQIPTFLLSKLTSEHVTVALSGDGGDELFGGYNRYLWTARYWPWLRKVPISLRRLLASAGHQIPESALYGLERKFASLPPQLANKYSKFLRVLPLAKDEVYLELISQIHRPTDFAHYDSNVTLQDFPDHVELLDQMRVLDAQMYLPDDVLQKVDRASMANGLEVRPAFLDQRVCKFVAEMSRDQLIHKGETKWLLRQVLQRYVPRELIDRPKMGFGVPLAQWLRGPLQEWANDLVRGSNFGGGFLKRDSCSELLTTHINSQADNSYSLWNILTLAAWFERWGGR